MGATNTTPTPHAPIPTPALSPLSRLDLSILTRLYELPSLHALHDSLKANPIPGAPSSLFELTQWSLRPDIKPWIDSHAAQVRDADQREMIALLKDIARTSDNQVERRRAATTILRTLSGGTPLRGVRHALPSHGSDDQRAASRAENVSTPTRPSHAPPPGDQPLIPDHPRRITEVPPPKLDPELLTQAAGAATLAPSDLARLAMRLSLRRNQPEYLEALKSLLIPHATLENKPYSNLVLELPHFHPTGAMDFQPRGQPTPTFCQIRITAPKPPNQIISLIRYPNPTDPWRIADISTDPDSARCPDSS